MEAAIFFLIAGTCLYFVNRLYLRFVPRFSVPGLILSGILLFVIIRAMAGKQLLQGLDVPFWIYILCGALTGGLLWSAGRYQLFVRPGIRYVSTLLLAFILSIFYWLTLKIYFNTTGIHHINQAALFLVTFLWGFGIAFGYGFPSRWFKSR